MRYGDDYDIGGFRCYCGEWVACYHQECLALLPEEIWAKLMKERLEKIDELKLVVDK